MCVDFRKLNLVTKKDCFPLSRVDETRDALVGARFFSSLDLLMGNHQLEIDGFKQVFSHRVPSGKGRPDP